MSNHEESLEHKLQHERDGEVSIKIQKLDGNEESIKTTEPTTSITNIYYDCLERIFEFLDLKSLLNVAQTCKRLQIAAAAYYNDWRGAMKIVLIPKNFFNNLEKGVWYVNDDDKRILVIGMKFCLPYLRCFGSKIEELYVRIIQPNNRVGIIDRYINQYCADTISKIWYFGREQKFSNESFLKPFKRIKHVGILLSENFNQLPNFVDWFPNLCHLNIDSQSMRHCEPVHFPSMEYLVLGFTCNAMEESVQIFKKFLHANKQIQHIAFWAQVRIQLTMSNVLDMLSNNQLIAYLTIWANGNIVINADGSELLRLENEHPKMIKLDWDPCLLDVDDAISFIRMTGACFKKLKCFKFRVKNHFEYNRLLSMLDDSMWKHEFNLDENIVDHHVVTLTKCN